jgi:uncharacterized protein (DUF1697 family)
MWVGSIVECGGSLVGVVWGGTQHAECNSSEECALNPDTNDDPSVTFHHLWQGVEMATWIVLLRGVNVGGKNKVAMSGLRELVTTLGHTEVSTYIQSGNIVMTSPRSDRSAVAAEICAGIEKTFGPKVFAVLRQRDELSAALAANPFTTDDGTRVLITFLSDAPSPDDIALLERDRFLPDQFEVVGSELYGYYPNGAGRSKMTLDYFEKRLQVRGTARNLNTVAKLIELSGG